MAKKTQTIGGLGIPTDGALTYARTGKKPQTVTNGLQEADGKIVVRPAYVTEVDMSTIEKPEGAKVQEYDLAQVEQDLDAEDRTPTGPLTAVAEATKPEGGKKAKRQAKLAVQGGENPDSAKPAKATKPAPPPPFQAIQWQHGDLNTVCTLADLMPLDETGLRSANVAMREIHPENVANLRNSYRRQAEGLLTKRIPAISVVWSNRDKFVPFDGNHRWMAQSKNLMEDLGLDPEQKASASDPRYVEALSKTNVDIQICNDVAHFGDVVMAIIDENDVMAAEKAGGSFYPISNRDLIILAFTANTEHGLPTSTYGRTSYGIWWMEDYVERMGKTYHGIQQDACRIAGVKKDALSVALRRARDKASAKAKQPVDLTYLPEDDQDELDAQTERADRKGAEDRLAQTCKRLIATAKSMLDLFEDEETAHSYLAQYVLVAADEEALSNLAAILSIGFDVPEKAEDETAEE